MSFQRFFACLTFSISLHWGDFQDKKKTRPKLTHTSLFDCFSFILFFYSFLFRLVYPKPIAQKSICIESSTLSQRKIGWCQNLILIALDCFKMKLQIFQKRAPFLSIHSKACPQMCTPCTQHLLEHHRFNWLKNNH